jgi:HAMP domain-containing protein
MSRIGAGDLAVRTGLPHTTSEVGRLATALDEMAERLEAGQGGSVQPPGSSR